MKYLVGWNDEYLDMRIIAGPFTESKQEEIIKKEVIRVLIQTYAVTEEEANIIYEISYDEKNKEYYDKSELDEVKKTIGCEPELVIYKTGASLRYGDGYEDRLQVVEYTTELKIETPAGTICSSIMPTYDYPGISTLIEKDGQPGIIMEYDPIRERIMARVYSSDDPDGDPVQLIDF